MENFNDLLEEINRMGGPLMWITHKRSFIQYQSEPVLRRRTPEEIKNDVMSSARLRHTIDQILAKSSPSSSSSAAVNLKREDVIVEARKIVDEMAHQFDQKYVRMLGYVVIKVFARIYKHIFYNSDAVDNLSVVKTHPTLLLPLHRSYMDFLLVSIICFHTNIQLPAVAAGEDFLGLGFMAKVIRHTGAFFIRRSFGSDELYWSIFHEYVQQHLLNCDRPLEFFIEGTRSRTSKSLRPKQGMLATCVESFLKGHRAQDIYFLPISLTYERLLEESLYSNELLGIPKPKETVGGLVKARSILNECYGSIFANFGRPISLREILGRLDAHSSIQPERSLVNLTPGFIFEITPQQTRSIEALSYVLLLEMLKNQIIQPMSLISTCLLLSTQHDGFDSERSIGLNTLCFQIDKLKRILTNLGSRIHWPVDLAAKSNQDSDDSTRLRPLVLENLRLHTNLFEWDPKLERITLKQAHRTDALNEKSLFESASLFIALCSYRNQLINNTVRVSFLSVALVSSMGERFNLTAAYEVFKFLATLFNREFIFRTEDEEIRKDFEQTLSCLLHLNVIKRPPNTSELELEKLNVRQLILFCKHIQPVLENYTLIFEIMGDRSISPSFTNEKEFVKSIQTNMFRLMLDRTHAGCGGFDLEALSLNMISNAVMSLKQYSVLRRLSAASPNEIDRPRLLGLYRKLKYVLTVTRSRLNELIRTSRRVDGENEPRDFSFRESGVGGSDQGVQFAAEYQELFETVGNTSAKI